MANPLLAAEAVAQRSDRTETIDELVERSRHHFERKILEEVQDDPEASEIALERWKGVKADQYLFEPVQMRWEGFKMAVRIGIEMGTTGG